MAVVEEVITVYKADVSDYSAKFQEIENRLKTQEAAIASFGEKGKEAFGKAGNAAKEAGEKTTAFGKQLEDLGKKLVAAFAVERIIAFGTASVKAFQDAEKAAIKLQTAVGVSGGLQKDFQKLIEQSKQLEKISIFSDDDIQAAQTMALQFGLTSKEVDELIPKIVDYASATGKDLNSALNAVISGINGQGKELKKNGIILNEGATATENLARINDQLSQVYSGQAKIIGDTAFGAQQKLNNELNNQQEIIGEKLVPIYQTLRGVFLDFINGVVTLINAGADLFNSDKSILNPANWFKAKDGASEFNQKFKDLVDLTIKAEKDTPTEKIRLELSALAKEYNTLTGEAKLNAQATVTALNQILKERESASQSAFKSASELKKLTDEQLKSERELANNKTGVAARTAVQLIDREIKAREDAAKKNKQIQSDIEKITKDRLDRENKALEKALAIDLENLEQEKQRELALEEANGGLSTQEKLRIDLKYLEARKKLFEGDAVEQEKIDTQIAATKTKINEQANKDRIEADTAHSKQQEKLRDKDVANTKKTEKEKQEAIQQTLELSVQITSAIADLLKATSDARIQDLESQRDEQLAAFDKQQEDLEKSHENKKVSERQFENESAKIKEQRVEAEKKINKQISEEKKKQAVIAKEIAIFESIINTATSILKTAAQLGFPAAIPFIVAAGVLGALQLATIIAAPIPKFAKGKREGEAAGLSMVGEEGAELMFVPDNARILPANKVRTFGEAIDAMYGNKWDSYINDKYITPALIAYKAKQDKIKDKSFAENLAQSLMFNGGIDEYGMARVMGKGIKIANVNQLADAIARKTGERYSSYMN